MSGAKLTRLLAIGKSQDLNSGLHDWLMLHTNPTWRPPRIRHIFITPKSDCIIKDLELFSILGSLNIL
ncbi:hypothetical protein FRX31_019044 [Thalictrum thalictroides]|uniref:Uncharacterized protein n=1 Tax=Thalictrum thalictroides TaxID=46969 RepID=A0A7J6W2Q4_THATH|nr:hypothetical protein FRX31_019044 [Thalictrum thalictroides]